MKNAKHSADLFELMEYLRNTSNEAVKLAPKRKHESSERLRFH